MIEFLTNIDIESYTQFILIWGALGIISAISIHFLKLMPISSRVESAGMSVLGNINKRTGWIIMETPVLVSVIYFYLVSKDSVNASVIFIGIFVFHYINRALIFPYRIKVNNKTMPVASMLMSMVFYIINGYLIGYYFGTLQEYSWEWLKDPRFIIGLLVFIVGFYINVTSDNILINLRKPGETGYKIPRGGFFKHVSCPNYFGEILEWVGFAIMSWCLPAVIYALWVALPLIAQGIQAHKWYQSTFKEDYPAERKAIIPAIL